jgi:hypothetical protein
MQLSTRDPSGWLASARAAQVKPPDLCGLFCFGALFWHLVRCPLRIGTQTLVKLAHRPTLAFEISAFELISLISSAHLYATVFVGLSYSPNSLHSSTDSTSRAIPWRCSAPYNERCRQSGDVAPHQNHIMQRNLAHCHALIDWARRNSAHFTGSLTSTSAAAPASRARFARNLRCRSGRGDGRRRSCGASTRADASPATDRGVINVVGNFRSASTSK